MDNNENYQEQAEKWEGVARVADKVSEWLEPLGVGAALALVGLIVLKSATFPAGVMILAGSVLGRFIADLIANHADHQARLYRRLYHATPWRRVPRQHPRASK